VLETGLSHRPSVHDGHRSPGRSRGRTQPDEPPVIVLLIFGPDVVQKHPQEAEPWAYFLACSMRMGKNPLQRSQNFSSFS
jgi:hypothetical protein